MRPCPQAAPGRAAPDRARSPTTSYVPAPGLALAAAVQSGATDGAAAVRVLLHAGSTAQLVVDGLQLGQRVEPLARGDQRVMEGDHGPAECLLADGSRDGGGIGDVGRLSTCW